MVNLDKFISDSLDCLGWPHVSPGGTGIGCSWLAIRAYKKVS